MDLIFVKIKNDYGDAVLLNVREIVDIQPHHGRTGGWNITLTNSTEHIVCDEVVNRICGAIKRFGEIVDCTCNRERFLKTLDCDHPKEKNDDPLLHVAFD